jgi:polyphosphate kinase 2 (PPK2 family)
MDTETIASIVLNEEQLSLDLIEAQYALMNTRDQSNAKSLVILVSGIELAGKGEAVKQLRMGRSRFLYVKADPPHLFNLKQPFWQPYTDLYLPKGKLWCGLVTGMGTCWLRPCMLQNL